MNRQDICALIIRLAPPAPPCWTSRNQWVEWLNAASERPDQASESALLFASGKPVRFNHKINFCQDCTNQYRSSMIKSDRCRPRHLINAARVVE